MVFLCLINCQARYLQYDNDNDNGDDNDLFATKHIYINGYGKHIKHFKNEMKIS